MRVVNQRLLTSNLKPVCHPHASESITNSCKYCGKKTIEKQNTISLTPNKNICTKNKMKFSRFASCISPGSPETEQCWYNKLKGYVTNISSR
jgi:hypothetical protein